MYKIQFYKITLFYLFHSLRICPTRLKKIFLHMDILLISVSGFGFPSGHAQMAMVVWGWLGDHYNRIIPASVMIFMVGFSRIYLGVHMPHQIIGGWAVGFVVFMGWIFVEKELSKNS